MYTALLEPLFKWHLPRKKAQLLLGRRNPCMENIYCNHNRKYVTYIVPLWYQIECCSTFLRQTKSYDSSFSPPPLLYSLVLCNIRRRSQKPVLYVVSLQFRINSAGYIDAVSRSPPHFFFQQPSLLMIPGNQKKLVNTRRVEPYKLQERDAPWKAYFQWPNERRWLNESPSLWFT